MEGGYGDPQTSSAAAPHVRRRHPHPLAGAHDAFDPRRTARRLSRHSRPRTLGGYRFRRRRRRDRPTRRGLRDGRIYAHRGSRPLGHHAGVGVAAAARARARRSTAVLAGDCAVVATDATRPMSAAPGSERVRHRTCSGRHDLTLPPTGIRLLRSCLLLQNGCLTAGRPLTLWRARRASHRRKGCITVPRTGGW